MIVRVERQYFTACWIKNRNFALPTFDRETSPSERKQITYKAYEGRSQLFDAVSPMSSATTALLKHINSPFNFDDTKCRQKLTRFRVLNAPISTSSLTSIFTNFLLVHLLSLSSHHKQRRRFRFNTTQQV